MPNYKVKPTLNGEGGGSTGGGMYPITVYIDNEGGYVYQITLNVDTLDIETTQDLIDYLKNKGYVTTREDSDIVRVSYLNATGVDFKNQQPLLGIAVNTEDSIDYIMCMRIDNLFFQLIDDSATIEITYLGQEQGE